MEQLAFVADTTDESCMVDKYQSKKLRKIQNMAFTNDTLNTKEYFGNTVKAGAYNFGW